MLTKCWIGSRPIVFNRSARPSYRYRCFSSCPGSVPACYRFRTRLVCYGQARFRYCLGHVCHGRVNGDGGDDIQRA